MKLRKNARESVLNLIDRIAQRFDYAVVPKRSTIDFYLHEYSSYEEYRNVQVHHNHRKISQVWADKITMRRVAELAHKHSGDGEVIKGLCHGTRNGFEQGFLNSLDKKIKALGTDISDTATQFPDTIQWDFHTVNPDWIGAFDFVYTNSLDQSWQPRQALTTWLEQLKPTGRLIIEHTEAHGPIGASEMDPFGVKPTVVPYILTQWFGSQISIEHSVARKENKSLDAWLFVISKNVAQVT